jgi:hypothetical protein
MRTRTGRALLTVGLTALAALVMSSTASARPITFTEHHTFSESFSDGSTVCQEELYTNTVNGRTLTHLTIATDEQGNPTLPLHFRDVTWGNVVAVPLDGTGVSYTGRFYSSDSENIRGVRHGSLFVEKDTDINKFMARGSDGSHVMLQEHHHFTVNANGDVAIEFDKVRAIC